MTKKTRVRVARIAAGAIVAAGASLMVTGVAQADDGPLCDIVVTPDCEENPGGETPSTDPTDPEIPSTDPTDPEIPSTDPTDPEIPSTDPTDPGTPSTDPTEPGTPSTDPTEPTTDPTEPGPTETSGSANGNGGGNNTDPDGGASTQEQGSSALTDTGEQAPASDTSAQGGKELAETGAAETTFLLIGAATMIAGGIGFRVLPRMMGGRGAAA
ncbi:hypothetical protein [Streptomyces sp. SID5910]|uniref:hypothetical protein n=1 Tax=Streptomyces sp. SID5910 TaxID=2690312 RepID=UPI001367B0CD|nr:hypothetical protein [Streptomyces sp. SID5910]MYR46848.1 hypothetical protein [Streptomyces sp. SID5910]